MLSNKKIRQKCMGVAMNSKAGDRAFIDTAFIKSDREARDVIIFGAKAFAAFMVPLVFGQWIFTYKFRIEEVFDHAVFKFSLALDVFTLIAILAFLIVNILAKKNEGFAGAIHYPSALIFVTVISLVALTHMYLTGTLHSMQTILIMAVYATFSWYLKKGHALTVLGGSVIIIILIHTLEVAGILRYAPIFKSSQIMGDIFLDPRIMTMNIVVFIVILTIMTAVLLYSRAILEMTQRKLQIEVEKKSRMEKALAESNKDLQNFAYVASHDLKEPLRMVTGYMRLLRERYSGQLDSDANEFIDFAYDGAERMDEMITDLLDLSRIDDDSGQMKSIALNDTLESVLQTLEKEIADSGAAIKTGELPKVWGNPSHLNRLFTNLIANSVKFRGEAMPMIEISSKTMGGFHEISISDNGIGVGKEFHMAAFDMFRRLNPQDAYKGSGMGLAICKKIVTIHNGQIRMESELGKGTSVIFTLPVGERD